MPLEQRPRKSGGYDDLHTVPVWAWADIGNFSLLAGWGKDRQLVVFASSKAKVVQATRGNSVGSPEGSHVRFTVVRRSADQAFDCLVSDHEVPDDSVGFFALGQKIDIVLGDFEYLDLGGSRYRKGDERK